MFHIKICGMTNVADAVAAARAGADAVGLNFYAKSPRCITQETAKKIVAALPTGVVRVGLFVDTPSREICRLYDELPLDLIQLHGDQPPEFLSQLGDRPVMRAFRLGAGGLGPIQEYLNRCRGLGSMPQMILLDALVAGQFGGTGQTTDWQLAGAYAAESDRLPLVLAGGLTPSNVMDAIRLVRPDAVDVASGVEFRTGHKDASSVGAFVDAARQGFGFLA
ncbi:MAG: phosphoribosylanthranilate isomerase [Thermoguttaceae bacterium]